MQIQKIIQNLGYTSNEAKVYLAALSLGESHVSDIATRVNLPRSSVQIILDKLHKNGLMNFYVMNRYKYWVAESPEKLLKQLQQREEMIKSVLPELSRLKKQPHAETSKPIVRVFNGLEEIKLIFDDIIETKHPIFAILPHDQFLTMFEGTTILEDFTETRVKQFLRMRMLVPDTDAGQALKKDTSIEFQDVRILPERIDIQSASFTYGSKVAFIMLNKTQPAGVIIDDQGIRDTKMVLFEELWNQSDSNMTASSYSDNMVKAFADGQSQPILITNDSAEIVYVNSAWEQQFGYQLQEVQGKNPRILQSGKTPRSVYQTMWQSLKAGKQFQSDEIIDKKKSGEFFNLLTTVFPMKIRGKLFYIQILDDITERKRVEQVHQTLVETAGEDITVHLDRLEIIPKILEGSGQDNVARAIEDEVTKLKALTKKILKDKNK